MEVATIRPWEKKETEEIRESAIFEISLHNKAFDTVYLIIFTQTFEYYGMRRLSSDCSRS